MGFKKDSGTKGKKPGLLSADFGVKGWNIILFLFFVMWIGSGVSGTSMNVVPSLYAETKGWDEALLNVLATIATWISLAFVALFAVWCGKKGPSVVISTSLILGAVSYYLWGRCGSVPEYAIWLSLIMIAANAYNQIGFGVLIANWFPTKKGVAMGLITIGTSFQGMTFVGSLNHFTEQYGFTSSFNFYALVLLILAAWCFLFIRSNPEDAGAFPDNDRSMTKERMEMLRAEGERYKKNSPWTFQKLLLSKDVWLIGITGGFFALFTVGIVSNLIPMGVSFGLKPESAVAMLAVASVLAIPFSYLWGLLDQKIGTKKAAMGMGIWFILSIIIVFIPGTLSFYIFCVMFGSTIGGANNFAISLTTSVFGRYDFNNAWGIIFIINVVLRAFGFSVVGGLSAMTGNYNATFISLLFGAVICIIVTAFVSDRCIGRNFVENDDYVKNLNG